MRLLVTLTAALVGLAPTACTRADAAAEPDVLGVVKHVELLDPSFQTLAVVRLDAARGNGAANNADASISLTGASEVYLASPKGEQRTDFRALSPGQMVEVWYTGPTGETNPTQGQARKITIHQNR